MRPQDIPDLLSPTHPFTVRLRKGERERFGDIDPSVAPRRSWVSEKEYRFGRGENALKAIDADTLLRMYREKSSIRWHGKRHDLFEAAAHVVFPRRAERVFAYVLIWVLRDDFTSTDIAGFLKVSSRRAAAFIRHATERWSEFISNSSFSHIRCREDLLSVDDATEMIAREETYDV